MHGADDRAARDAAEATVEELGELGSLMFVDLNEGVTAFQRNFVSEMKRCDEMERHLRFFEEQVALAGLTLSKRSWVERPGALTELQSQLEEHHNDLHQLNGNQTKLVTSYNYMVHVELGFGLPFGSQNEVKVCIHRRWMV